MTKFSRFHFWAMVNMAVAVIAGLLSHRDLAFLILTIANIWWISGEVVVELRKPTKPAA